MVKSDIEKGGMYMPHCNKKMLSFFLTTRCNLCCRYCYNIKERSSIKEKTIPIKIAKAAVDWYFDNNDSRHIRFYGPGEPTREVEKMKEITAYAKLHRNRGCDVTVEIQTNGVFGEDVRSWINENVNIVWMSFDGMKNIQEYNRPLNPKYNAEFGGRTSAEVLEDNVRWLTGNSQSTNPFVGARVTITDLNISRQIEMIDYFQSLGINYIWTDPIFYSVGQKPVSQDKEKQLAYSFDMDAYVENYLEAYSYAKSKGAFWGSFLTINFDGESEYHCRSCHPLSAPHITPDGFISACDMVVLGEKAYHMDPFIVGKWNEDNKCFDLDLVKIDALDNRRTSNMKYCKNCEIQLHCGGCCLGETVNEFGILDGHNPTKCKAIHQLYEALGACESYPYLHP